MFVISGWEELFIKQQLHCHHIIETIQRRNIIEKIPIQPPIDKMFDAFKLCSYNIVKLVILGQEPYKEGSTGLAFSSDKMTPSLEVIKSWLKIENINPCLDSWAKQGVLLLNASMTLEVTNDPISHRVIWEYFIRECLELCSKKDIVFLLLGNTAFKYSSSIQDGLVLKVNHPAYYARTNNMSSKKWLFDEINEYLVKRNYLPINFYSISV